MKLYFLDAFDRLEFVCEASSLDGAMKSASEDIETRRPNRKVYYTRQWFEDNGDMWLDFGSHTEFYIATDRKLEGFNDL